MYKTIAYWYYYTMIRLLLEIAQRFFCILLWKVLFSGGARSAAIANGMIFFPTVSVDRSQTKKNGYEQ